jgi:hypothetical protein
MLRYEWYPTVGRLTPTTFTGWDDAEEGYMVAVGTTLPVGTEGAAVLPACRGDTGLATASLRERRYIRASSMMGTVDGVERNRLDTAAVRRKE